MSDRIIRLRKGKSGALRPGHPWIFKGTIAKLEAAIKPGDIVTVVTNEGKFVGRGYFNPSSKIAVRLLTFKDETIDEQFLFNRVKEAVEKRADLSSTTNARRLIYSEADSLPGLIADLYNDTLVLQVFTLGMEKLKPAVLKAIKEIIDPRFIFERSDSPFRKIEKLEPIKQWIGQTGNVPIEISENGAKFLVDIINGHKTGFYLDQRRSRLALREMSKNKKVLDLFCYTGGFSINAALGGAKKVIGVDIKKDWLDLARENAGLNNVSGVAEFSDGDAFEAIKNICNSGEKFDIIIVDPPSFLKSKRDIKSAAKGYKEINSLAFKSLNDGGMLCTFSCSHNMPNEMFSDVIKAAAAASGKKFTILKRCRQDRDHPISRHIPETEYLKGYFLKVST